MSNEVKIIECPRDAWQGLKGQIPTALKVQYLRALIGAGFKHIDAVSFVSPKAIPQMADSEAVLKELDPPDDVEIIGIVVNQKGAERAIATEAVQTLGFPYSVSPTFLERNQHQILEAAADELEQIKLKADAAGLNVVAYISMAFGNPYGDLWNAEEVIEAVGILADMNITQISLADTVGLATPEQVKELISAMPLASNVQNLYFRCLIAALCPSSADIAARICKAGQLRWAVEAPTIPQLLLERRLALMKFGSGPMLMACSPPIRVFALTPPRCRRSALKKPSNWLITVRR